MVGLGGGGWFALFFCDRGNGSGGSIEFVECVSTFFRVSFVVWVTDCVELTSVYEGGIIILDPHEASSTSSTVWGNVDELIVQVGGC